MTQPGGNIFMHKDELRAKIYSKIEELPTLPSVLPRLMHLMEDEMVSTSHVAHIIARDPALPSKMLKAANDLPPDLVPPQTLDG